MLNIYVLKPAANAQSLSWRRTDDAVKRGLLGLINPATIRDWKTLECFLDNPSSTATDFLWMGSLLCASKEIFTALEDVIGADLAPLPITVDGTNGEYVILFPANALDCTRDAEIAQVVAMQRSIFPFPYLFRRDAFTRSQVFRVVTQFPRQLFCASLHESPDDFQGRINALGLTGIEFRCVARFDDWRVAEAEEPPKTIRETSD